MPRLPHLIALLFLLTLPSCIDGDEEVRINADGSGTASLHLTAPTLFFANLGELDSLIALAHQRDKQSNNVSIHSLRKTTLGLNTTLHAELSVKNFRKLDDFLHSFRDPTTPETPSDLEHIIGSIITDIKFPNSLFVRTINLAPLLKGQNLPPMSTSILANSHITYTMRLPTPAKTHNATLTKYNGRTLIWQIPISQLLAGPVTLSYEAPIPVPWRKISLFSFPLAFILALRWLRRKKQTHNPSSPCPASPSQNTVVPCS